MKNQLASINARVYRDIENKPLTATPAVHAVKPLRPELPEVVGAALSAEDWTEIYYALEYKLNHSPAVTDDERWKAHLRSIIAKIGPDGDTAAKPLKVLVEVEGGVADVTTCPAGVEVEIIDHDNEKVGE